MAVLQADQIADLVTGTLKDLGRMKWTDIASRLTKYTAVKRMIKKSKVTFGSGIGMQWNLIFNYSDSTRRTGLYQSDLVNTDDGQTQATAPWRHVTTAWAYDERELTMNTGAARITDYVKSKRIRAMIGFAEFMEADFWTAPSSSDDNQKTYGVPYYIVKNATEGFNGGAPSGHTTVAGVSPTTYPRWKNYTGPYAAITKDDLIAVWKRAADLTDFTPPVEIPQYGGDNDYGWFTNLAIKHAFETLAEAQNENLGNDLDSKDSKVLFRRVPIEYVPYLDADTENPIYGINFSEFKTAFLTGEYMKDSGMKPAPNQHRVQQCFVDNSYNYLSYNRRNQFILYNPA